MRTALAHFVVAFFCLLSTVDSGRQTTMYTIKKFNFWFSDEFFTNKIAFYQPVRGKWGRIYVNLTTARKFKDAWIDFKAFRRDEDLEKTFQQMSLKFSINLCDIIEEKSPNVLYQLIVGIDRYMRNLICKCPIEKGTNIVVPDQILPKIPRQGQMPMIPRGYYRFAIDFQTTQPNATLGSTSVEFQFRGFW